MGRVVVAERRRRRGTSSYHCQTTVDPTLTQSWMFLYSRQLMTVGLGAAAAAGGRAVGWLGGRGAGGPMV